MVQGVELANIAHRRLIGTQGQDYAQEFAFARRIPGPLQVDADAALPVQRRLGAADPALRPPEDRDHPLDLRRGRAEGAGRPDHGAAVRGRLGRQLLEFRCREVVGEPG